MKIFGERKIAYAIYAAIALVFLIIQAVFSIIGRDEPNNGRKTNAVEIERNVNFQKRYEGIVLRKFNDKKNHNEPTIEIRLTNGSTFYLLSYGDKTGFYEFVQKGDSIFKDDWGFTYRIKRDEYEREFIIHPDYIDKK
ncbi:hypothetical protein [uncultured Draconibacterium sp.]|uniref:hypothetical protein n=1 Tax=uncultured Draconibacterium sp. TaxID=1573823 RepID=UPI0029BFC52F|nr:hypothetical protein [uncultured Draconibacterium sp.]